MLRGLPSFLILCLTLLASSAPAWGYLVGVPPALETPGAATQPAATVPLPASIVAVRDAAFSPDGQSVFITGFSPEVNVWSIPVHYAPQVAAALALLAALLMTLIMLRIRRRPQVVGQPHCRRCGYALTGSDGPTCPECGSGRGRPVLGLSLRRRLLVPVIALLACLVLSGLFLLPSVHRGLWHLGLRRERAAEWFQWNSRALGEAAAWRRSPSWLHRFRKDQSVLARIGLAQGEAEILATLPKEPGIWTGTPPGHRLVPTTDPNTLAIVGDQDRSVFLFDASSCTLRLGPKRMTPTAGAVFMTADGLRALDPHGGSLHSRWIDEGTSHHRAPSTMTQIEAGGQTVEVWRSNEGKGRLVMWHGQRWAGVSHNDRLVYLLVSDSKPLSIAVVAWDTAGHRWLTRTPLTRGSMFSELSVSADGAKLIVVDPQSRNLQFIDMSAYVRDRAE